MRKERILELLRIERECVLRGGTCDRLCACCELVQRDTELLEMYDAAIVVISRAEDNDDMHG